MNGSPIVTELRNKVRGLFQDKKVDLVIGWGQGTLPMTATPIFIHREEDVDKLIFDETCRNNLAYYLTKDRRDILKTYPVVGIVVKGCDARSLALYLSENQIKREHVVIIGVPCAGVIEPRKLREQTAGKHVNDWRRDGDTFFIRTKDSDIESARGDMLSDSCLDCRYPDALVHDIFIGVPRSGKEDEGDPFPEVTAFENLSSEERWKHITEEFSRCIRCYACRNVCPSCYCQECVVDWNDPQWFGKTPELTDTLLFHLIRQMHIAGRCVDCGACIRACPMDIDLRLLNRKVEKELFTRFGSIAGLDPDKKGALADFKENETQDFIMG